MCYCIGQACSYVCFLSFRRRRTEVAESTETLVHIHEGTWRCNTKISNHYSHSLSKFTFWTNHIKPIAHNRICTHFHSLFCGPEQQKVAVNEGVTKPAVTVDLHECLRRMFPPTNPPLKKRVCSIRSSTK